MDYDTNSQILYVVQFSTIYCPFLSYSTFSIVQWINWILTKWNWKAKEFSSALISMCRKTKMERLRAIKGTPQRLQHKSILNQYSISFSHVTILKDCWSSGDHQICIGERIENCYFDEPSWAAGWSQEREVLLKTDFRRTENFAEEVRRKVFLLTVTVVWVLS